MWSNIKNIVEEHVSSENVYLQSAGRGLRSSLVPTINKPTRELKLTKK